MFNEIVIALLAITMLVISLTVYGKMSTNTNAFDQASDDWKIPPIVDLKVIPNTLASP